MKEQDPLQVYQALLDAIRVGILCTIGTDGYPHTRWMTATTLPRVHNCIYCVSNVKSRKVKEIEACDCVEWSFQTPNLGEIVTVRGHAEVLHNPGLKGEVLEALGPNLVNFWRFTPNPANLVVIETVVESARLLRPMEPLPHHKEIS